MFNACFFTGLFFKKYLLHLAFYMMKPFNLCGSVKWGNKQLVGLGSWNHECDSGQRFLNVVVRDIFHLMSVIDYYKNLSIFIFMEKKSCS